MSDGYEAFKNGAALVDLSARGKIRMVGEDRVRLLHAMSTNHIEELQPGQSSYGFLLNPQGRILADFQVYCHPQHLLLDTEPETREKVFQQLDNYIIADDVTLEDVSSAFADVALEGPQAGEVLRQAGVPVPEEENAFVQAEQGVVARVSATGAAGFRIIVPSGLKETLVERLVNNGATRATSGELRMARIEIGRPRYGEELSEGYIPQETQVIRALHFTKGCYVGQEIVERVRSRGNVNKLLVQLRVDGDAVPEPGAEAVSGEKRAGVIVSAVELPDGVVAMAYLRAQFARPGAEVEVDGARAAVSLVKPV